MRSTVTVLLAAYNGEAYIRQMIESILSQDHKDIRIILSDDNSTDATASILDAYAAEYPHIITHYRSGLRFGCAQKHFMHLLQVYQDRPYIMFCDQDDVWHPDKVSITLKRMKELEQITSCPVLVHTDLRVVDRDLNTINDSFCSLSGLNGNRLALNQLLVQNVVTGCTVMVNSALARLACSGLVCERMIMHDWWLALLASCCGRSAFVPESTIDYRQHGNNSVGAKNVYSPIYLFKRLRSSSMRQAMKSAAAQADSFLKAYSHFLSEDQKEVISAFALTKDQNIFLRDKTYLQYGLLKNGLIRVAAQLLGL